MARDVSKANEIERVVNLLREAQEACKESKDLSESGLSSVIGDAARKASALKALLTTPLWKENFLWTCSVDRFLCRISFSNEKQFADRVYHVSVSGSSGLFLTYDEMWCASVDDAKAAAMKFIAKQRSQHDVVSALGMEEKQQEQEPGCLQCGNLPSKTHFDKFWADIGQYKNREGKAFHFLHSWICSPACAEKYVIKNNKYPWDAA